MDGKLFWAAPSNGTNMATAIKWCSVSNCAGTTATLLTSPGQAENPVCDSTNDELVWADSTSPFAGSVDSVVSIYRVATNGSNMRTMTSFYELESNDRYMGIGFPNGRSDRYFFARQTVTPAKSSLFYVSTNSMGVSPIQIAAGTPGQNGLNPGTTGWANDTLYVWNDSSGFNQISYEVALPNGVTGLPPVFYPGYILDGVIDNQSLYGAFTTLPADAIGVCSLSNCANPSILFRGQQNSHAFTQDSTAIYWSTVSSTGIGFTVWKGEK